MKGSGGDRVGGVGSGRGRDLCPTSSVKWESPSQSLSTDGHHFPLAWSSGCCSSLWNLLWGQCMGRGQRYRDQALFQWDMVEIPKRRSGSFACRGQKEKELGKEKPKRQSRKATLGMGRKGRPPWEGLHPRSSLNRACRQHSGWGRRLGSHTPCAYVSAVPLSGWTCHSGEVTKRSQFPLQ